MKRRSFVKATLLTGTLSQLASSTTMAVQTELPADASHQEFYELRVYILKNEAQQKLVEDYFKNAAIPAYKRLGISNIGVFTELKPTGQTKIYALIPFKSLQQFLSAGDKLANDTTYNEAAQPYLTASATEPAYERIESSLLQAFEHMPVLEVPAKTARIFELRRYESAGENAGKKKIDMFNTQGEIDIFKRTGLTPVFFGETIIGGLRPNLTYMLTFDDMAEHDRNWKLFSSDPEWKKISSMPDYADAKIVSRITSTFLSPTPFSQI
ncbi:NIPSNAP family protein [Ferruginibacter paludis]|uniref:NIPSNAP family protein n=1 Tax=Ferruginibacter paludis TaxID=1310417 RepID=UPI0025B3481E|nr:NIPSNAP family protein [Ferruginibacter paludis]MDN3656157.1 NIPSNAP family protein [Ferruginibacter paludis]